MLDHSPSLLFAIVQPVAFFSSQRGQREALSHTQWCIYDKMKKKSMPLDPFENCKGNLRTE